MQDHEHEREQDPASRGGGEETPTYGTSGERAPAEWGASQETPTHGSQDPPAYGAVSPHLPAYGAESPQPPAYDMGRPATPATPEHGAGSLQPPVYGAGGGQDSAPHETGREQPGYGTRGAQTDAFWVSNQQQEQPPPGHGSGGQQPPPYPGSWQPPGAGNWPPGTSFGQWGAPPQPPHRGRRALAFAVVAILGVGIGAAAAFGIADNNNAQPSASSPGASAVPTPGSQRAPLQNTGSSKINAQAIDNAVSPSVADVTSKLSYSNQTAEGTGIVLNSSGLVLTNNHVVNGATQVTAQIDGTGRTYTARVLGTDKTDDVALLQLQGASGLKAASIGDSSKAVVGDAVVALGNQGGQGGHPTVTSGAITNLNRTITAGDQGSADVETLHGMLQTDAYIAPGDSGGPLVNSAGQVIGMDTAAASNNTGQSELIGFAIPINHALSIAREMAAGHSSSTIQIGQRGFLGVGVQNIAAGCASGFGNFGPGGGTGSGSAPVNSGALVCDVYSGTPAQSAGLAVGDVITGVNGATITSAQSLTTAMRSQRPGNQVSLTWVDTNGQRHTATLTLVAGPAA
ncbi:MAG TPA: trypsin-like peptidase domain-containing protein [Streptosporangiaceae bacterium]|nr:trypsin-like peptidase domain-containing protein [Streptosporangiaceae bacterium]